MGRGMVQDIGDQMFQVFSQRLRAELEMEPEAEAPAATASPRAKPEVLDVGALGARAAMRTPLFWVAIALAAGVIYLLFR